MRSRDARLISIAASLRAGGMRIRWRDVLAARRALTGAGSRPDAAYEALRGAFHPRAREVEVFDAVVLGALDAARMLPPPSARRRGGSRRPSGQVPARGRR
ncbi:MAG: hypothetical protein WD844_01600 [Thermoleophilaceae bacterium]